MADTDRLSAGPTAATGRASPHRRKQRSKRVWSRPPRSRSRSRSRRPPLASTVPDRAPSMTCRRRAPPLRPSSPRRTSLFLLLVVAATVASGSASASASASASVSTSERALRPARGRRASTPPLSSPSSLAPLPRAPPSLLLSSSSSSAAAFVVAVASRRRRSGGRSFRDREGAAAESSSRIYFRGRGASGVGVGAVGAGGFADAAPLPSKGGRLSPEDDFYGYGGSGDEREDGNTPRGGSQRHRRRRPRSRSSSAGGDAAEDENGGAVVSGGNFDDRGNDDDDNDDDDDGSESPPSAVKGVVGKVFLARAAAAAIARRKQEGGNDGAEGEGEVRTPRTPLRSGFHHPGDGKKNGGGEKLKLGSLSNLTKKIDEKILAGKWDHSNVRRGMNEKGPATKTAEHVQHATDSMQSLLGYNHFNGDWSSDRNSTTFDVAVVFGKPLVRDQVSVEYAARVRALARLLKEEPDYRPRLICFVSGGADGRRGGGGAAGDGDGAVSQASAGYMYFRHLCASQAIPFDDSRTKVVLVDPAPPPPSPAGGERGGDGDTGWGVGGDHRHRHHHRRGGWNERDSMERVASDLWRRCVESWLSESPLVERVNRHYGVEWTILERKIDVHFTLVSTEYHLCNLNDVHHRSPGKSFLAPLVSLRGLVGSDAEPGGAGGDGTGAPPLAGGGGDEGAKAWTDPGYDPPQRNKKPRVTSRTTFGGTQRSIDTSWSFRYATYPFIHVKDDAVVFLGQCFLLGEELTPLLVNMRGVVEQTEFFQRDNYLLLSSIRRSLVCLVEGLYTEKGRSIRAGLIRYFEHERDRPSTADAEDTKVIVVLESALLNLGRCIDLVKPAGLLVSSVPAASWSKALDALEKSMEQIRSVCDPDRPLEAQQWGKLLEDHDDGC